MIQLRKGKKKKKKGVYKKNIPEGMDVYSGTNSNFP